MPAPFFDHGWNHAARLRDDTETHAVRNVTIENSPARIIWELGLVIAVPLAGAGLMEVVLRALQIY